MNKALNNDEMRRKRLKFRSWHRGWKETDLILGHFADTHLDTLTEPELAAYEQMLDCDDDVIWAWVTGKEVPPAPFLSLMPRICPHC